MRVPAGNIRCHRCKELLFQNTWPIRNVGGLLLSVIEWVVRCHYKKKHSDVG